MILETSANRIILSYRQYCYYNYFVPVAFFIKTNYVRDEHTRLYPRTRENNHKPKEIIEF